MPRVTKVSDLHLEHHDCILPGGDILIMAGDTLTAAHLEPTREDAQARAFRKRFKRFAKYETRKYEQVIEIGGNHTAYHCGIERAHELEREFWAEYAPNVKFLENQRFDINGVAFLGTTLWATCGVGNAITENRIRFSMNDFRLIETNRPLLDGAVGSFSKDGLRTFRVHDANALHIEAIAFLTEELKRTAAQGVPVIVVSHHAPSYRSKVEGGRSGDNGVDEAYYSNQDALIEANPHIRYWVHGHSHDSCSYTIGNTEIVSNQRGYSGERSSKVFDAEAVDFELEDLVEERMAA